jgi:cardiolipin synthase
MPTHLDERVKWYRRPIRWIQQHRKLSVTLFVGFAHALGALTSVKAIMEVRTAQGAIAWAVALNTFPYVAVPAYWVLGRSSFEGYVVLRREADAVTTETARQLQADLKEFAADPNVAPVSAAVLERLTKLPTVKGNAVELLVDGEKTVDSIFKSIEAAQDYVLVQFYILRSDELGRKLQQALIRKQKLGVRCYVLYDELGSKGIAADYLSELRAAGVEIHPFNTTQGARNRFQLNFRNHRKIVVVDGRTAFIGGHNVGDEYLGKDDAIGDWRDTHVKVEGPIVQSVQIPFVEDWNWAARTAPKLNWTPQAAAANATATAYCLPSGPADYYETCTLFFLHAINSAKKRIWIASPYFVPDEQFISALQLAALRGVDVRILVPAKADSQLVYLSGFTFLPELEKAGVHTWRYQEGFLHEKALIVDDYCGVGTANFDNRSFRLNFEITMLFSDAKLLKDMEEMFARDFAKSKPAPASEFTDAPFYLRFAARAARLMAPVQ